MPTDSRFTPGRPPNVGVVLFAAMFAAAAATSCGEDTAGSPTGAGGTGACSPSTPTKAPGDEIGDVFPDLRLRRLASGGGAEESVHVHSFHTPCDQGLLLVRVEAPWCGPCAADADELTEVMAPFGAEISTLNLLLSGSENQPARSQDLLAWRAAHPKQPGAVARAEVGESFGGLVSRFGLLPAVFIVDRQTMQIVQSTYAPTRQELFGLLSDEVFTRFNKAVPLPFPAEGPKVDSRFTAREWTLVQGMKLPGAPKANATNKFADNAQAAALGAKLFADGKLAGDSGVSCASCHVADKGFADGLPVAKGAAMGGINTPGIALAAHQRYQFWDGRADSLWSQALGPMENALEMAGSRLGVVGRVRSTYAVEYEALFGPLPTTAWPLTGKPGDNAFDSLPEPERDAITRVFVNVGKAIEAHERTFSVSPSRFDAYLAGDFEKLNAQERDGLADYLHAGCITCHHGPTLSDDAFHNIGMPSFAPTGPGDRGRIDGTAALWKSPFRRDGAYSDQPEPVDLDGVSHPALLGQVKTPTLRGLKRTGPYGHGGTFKTLLEVSQHYGKAGKVEGLDGRVAGALDPALSRFTDEHVANVAAFLEALGE